MENKAVIIGIAGGSASGKTSITNLSMTVLKAVIE